MDLLRALAFPIFLLGVVVIIAMSRIDFSRLFRTSDLEKVPVPDSTTGTVKDRNVKKTLRKLERAKKRMERLGHKRLMKDRDAWTTPLKPLKPARTPAPDPDNVVRIQQAKPARATGTRRKP